MKRTPTKATKSSHTNLRNLSILLIFSLEHSESFFGALKGKYTTMSMYKYNINVLQKQRSWSPDTERDEAWMRRKFLHRDRRGRLSRSVTDEDLDELRGCMELGFSFDKKSDCERLSETFPALGLYHAVRRSCQGSEDGSPAGSPMSMIVSPGDTPELIKERLKQWAQVVGCSVRQRY